MFVIEEVKRLEIQAKIKKDGTGSISVADRETELDKMIEQVTIG